MFDKNDSKDIAIPEGLLTKGTQTVITGSIITNANTRNGVAYESKNLVVTSSDPLTWEVEGQNNLLVLGRLWRLSSLSSESFYRHRSASKSEIPDQFVSMAGISA